MCSDKSTPDCEYPTETKLIGGQVKRHLRAIEVVLTLVFLAAVISWPLWYFLLPGNLYLYIGLPEMGLGLLGIFVIRLRLKAEDVKDIEFSETGLSALTAKGKKIYVRWEEVSMVIIDIERPETEWPHIDVLASGKDLVIDRSIERLRGIATFIRKTCKQKRIECLEFGSE